MATNDLARRQQEWQAKQMKEAMRKKTKREKEEQWRQSMEQGAFKTIAGKQQLIDHFRVIVDRHQRCQMKRNQIVLGREPPDLKVHSECYDREVAAIKWDCTKDQMFPILMENYDDMECFSMDMDQKIDEQTTYRYAGHTAMRVSRTLSGTRSGSSESTVDAAPGLEWERPRPDVMEKPPDLDRMITMLASDASDVSGENDRRRDAT